ncbi:hypothetical protein RB195_025891 [Necator americanus]|uniref:TIL domain-containing protein n=1 Tax=Necator americanus TaxID=51031 RepID=A0ABR1EUD1_NECAM
MIRGLVLLSLLFCVTFAAKRDCPANEEWMECGTPCEPKCNQPMPDICTMNCIVDVCQCKEGYKRHETKGCLKEGSADCK